LRAELKKFKEWLPGGLLQLVKRIHDFEAIRVKRLKEQKDEGLEQISMFVNSLIDRVINPVPVAE
jgi:hypothetical protein